MKIALNMRDRSVVICYYILSYFLKQRLSYFTILDFFIYGIIQIGYNIIKAVVCIIEAIYD